MVRFTAPPASSSYSSARSLPMRIWLAPIWAAPDTILSFILYMLSALSSSIPFTMSEVSLSAFFRKALPSTEGDALIMSLSISSLSSTFSYWSMRFLESASLLAMVMWELVPMVLSRRFSCTPVIIEFRNIWTATPTAIPRSMKKVCALPSVRNLIAIFHSYGISVSSVFLLFYSVAVAQFFRIEKYAFL